MYFNTHFVEPPSSTVTDTSQSASTLVGLPSTTVTYSHTSQSLENDIGKLVQSHDDLNELSREHNHRVLTTEPDRDTSSYPRTRPSDSDPYHHQFQPSWLKQHPWFHYSRHDDGVYCRACAFFAPKQVGGQDLGQFVTKSFKYWGKLLQKASAHAMKNYHLSSMMKMTAFIA